MTLPESARRLPDAPQFQLSPPSVERLGALLAGLDQLNLILALPGSPVLSEAGVLFSHYRLYTRLGAGQFGIVVLADDLQLNRKVIIKVPQPRVLADPSLRDRFVREARVAARLHHPGIVAVLSTGEGLSRNCGRTCSSDCRVNTACSRTRRAAL